MSLQIIQNIRMLVLMALSTLVLMACGTGDEDAFLDAIEVNKLNITSIEVRSDNNRVALTETETYVAWAGLNGETPSADNIVTDKVNWSSSNPDIVSIAASGVATGVSNGTVEIRADWADLSASKSLDSSDAPLASLAIAPDSSEMGVCTTSSAKALVVTGTYDDGTSGDITDEVVWSSDLDGVSVDENGIVSTFSVGNATVTATHEGLSDTATVDVQDTLDSIAVTPANLTLYKGDTQQFIATGTYDDTSTADISGTVVWTAGESDGSAIDYLSFSTTILGLATADNSNGTSTGTATVTATCDAVASTALAVTIEPAVTLTGIQINDGNSTENLFVSNASIQLDAKLVLSDNSIGSDVTDDDDTTTWSVLSVISGAAAEVGSSTGLVTFSAVGETQIKVFYQKDDDEPVEDTIIIKVE